MSGESTRTGKSFATNAAGVNVDGMISSDVLLKLQFCNETFAADVAYYVANVLFRVLCEHVSVEVDFGWEHSGTEFAFKFVIALVDDSLMRRNQIFISELFSAVTEQGLAFGVTLNVQV